MYKSINKSIIGPVEKKHTHQIFEISPAFDTAPSTDKIALKGGTLFKPINNELFLYRLGVNLSDTPNFILREIDPV